MKSVFVESVKGGTGKSFVAVNTALRLVKMEKRVGLLDADVDSPNISDFLKVEKPKIEVTGVDVKRYNPIDAYGMQLFSMGWLTNKRAVYMRGARYAEIVADAVNYCNWDPRIEYFIVDMPAGLSDELHELVAVFGSSMLGSILVTQPSSVDDARRAIKVHILDEIPILGIVENMSQLICECGKAHKVFGESKTAKLAEQTGVEYLGSIPLSLSVHRSMEKGAPMVQGKEFKTLDVVTNKILSAKVQKPGFLRRLTERAKEMTRDLLENAIVLMLVTINREIPLKSIQEEGGFARGAIVEINLTDEELRRIKWKGTFQVVPGALVYKPSPREVDYKIYVWDKAFIWSLLGKAKLSDGSLEDYSFYDALLTNKIEFFRASDKAVRGTPDVFDLLNRLEGIGIKVGGPLEETLWKLA